MPMEAMVFDAELGFSHFDAGTFKFEVILDHDFSKIFFMDKTRFYDFSDFFMIFHMI